MNLFTEDYLIHHGIKGQKWGVRRFQNADGSLTNAGQRRYDSTTNLGTSSNPFLGRRVNASKEEREAHGKALSDQGRGRAGVIGRYLVRDAVIGAVSGCMQAPLSNAVKHGSAGAAAALNVVRLGTTVATATNTVKAWQDFRDIKTYRKSQK